VWLYKILFFSKTITIQIKKIKKIKLNKNINEINKNKQK